MKTQTKQISFNATKEDSSLISQIVDRAMKIVKEQGSDYTRMDCHMDITALHCNGNPLKLAELLTTDTFNFTHDVFGIARHINRATGQLEDFFVPRFSLPI